MAILYWLFLSHYFAMAIKRKAYVLCITSKKYQESQCMHFFFETAVLGKRCRLQKLVLLDLVDFLRFQLRETYQEILLATKNTIGLRVWLLFLLTHLYLHTQFKGTWCLPAHVRSPHYLLYIAAMIRCFDVPC